MISFIRVDNRLVHGQVVEGWLPFLKVKRVAVLDAEAAKSPLSRASMGLAVPPSVSLVVVATDAELAAIAQDAVTTLLLVRDVAGVSLAHAHGFPVRQLNLGNIHFKSGRQAITPSVFLDSDELAALATLAAAGVDVRAQALPTDAALDLREITTRFQAAGSRPQA
jgi:PTS system mannose-specific IIB component